MEPSLVLPTTSLSSSSDWTVVTSKKSKNKAKLKNDLLVQDATYVPTVSKISETRLLTLNEHSNEGKTMMATHDEQSVSATL